MGCPVHEAAWPRRPQLMRGNAPYSIMPATAPAKTHYNSPWPSGQSPPRNLAVHLHRHSFARGRQNASSLNSIQLPCSTPQPTPLGRIQQQTQQMDNSISAAIYNYCITTHTLNKYCVCVCVYIHIYIYIYICWYCSCHSDSTLQYLHNITDQNGDCCVTSPS